MTPTVYRIDQGRAHAPLSHAYATARRVALVRSRLLGREVPIHRVTDAGSALVGYANPERGCIRRVRKTRSTV